ncbi:MAG: hypothetical protein ACE5JX_15535 [Acidobacteriota bacterium]
MNNHELNGRRRPIPAFTLPWALFLLSLVPVMSNDTNQGVLKGKVQIASTAKDYNTVVYLKGVGGDAQLSQSALPSQPSIELDQENKEFVPHLLPIQKGQAVLFSNSDLFSHNVHAYWGRRSMFNVVQGIKGKHDWTPPRSGNYLILCDIHRNMSAFVFVFDHPFFASVPSHGKNASHFQIEGIPDGTYTLVAVRDIKKKLVRREQEITIKAGQTTDVSIQF